ncbi:hypothetical protein LEQ41_02700 [Streptococcus agalactiae]|nr:hypothetical protein [Streptococcus agalactiae]
MISQFVAWTPPGLKRFFLVVLRIDVQFLYVAIRSPLSFNSNIIFS